mmetsp:Transcript_58945/g.126689  ORF Transcript_58945/g.126689 Transcript_58945/m.126689 type:complete len:421 (+) Transcript_58945:106-1368(+)
MAGDEAKPPPRLRRAAGDADGGVVPILVNLSICFRMEATSSWYFSRLLSSRPSSRSLPRQTCIFSVSSLRSLSRAEGVGDSGVRRSLAQLPGEAAGGRATRLCEAVAGDCEIGSPERSFIRSGEMRGSQRMGEEGDSPRAWASVLAWSLASTPANFEEAASREEVDGDACNTGAGERERENEALRLMAGGRKGESLPPLCARGCAWPRGERLRGVPAPAEFCSASHTANMMSSSTMGAGECGRSSLRLCRRRVAHRGAVVLLAPPPNSPATARAAGASAIAVDAWATGSTSMEDGAISALSLVTTEISEEPLAPASMIAATGSEGAGASPSLVLPTISQVAGASTSIDAAVWSGCTEAWSGSELGATATVSEGALASASLVLPARSQAAGASSSIDAAIWSGGTEAWSGSELGIAVSVAS